MAAWGAQDAASTCRVARVSAQGKPGPKGVLGVEPEGRGCCRGVWPEASQRPAEPLSDLSPPKPEIITFSLLFIIDFLQFLSITYSSCINSLDNTDYTYLTS